jgi:molecular chaperone DnaK (HSP70)
VVQLLFLHAEMCLLNKTAVPATMKPETCAVAACVQAPLSTLLSRNKLKAPDVDAVELLGGGSRVPKLQAALSEALGGRWVSCGA